MKNLIKYLYSHNFTSAYVSFSTGASITGEWILNELNSNSTTSLEALISKIELLVCGGGPCDEIDLEPMGRRAGQVIMSKLFLPLAQSGIGSKHPFIERAGGNKALLSRLNYLLTLANTQRAQGISHTTWVKLNEVLSTSPNFRIEFLADTGQRVILPTGPLRWYRIFKPQLTDKVYGFIARNIKDANVQMPVAEHWEIKQLWSLIALLGISNKLKRELKFNEMALEVAYTWPKRRFVSMEYFQSILDNPEKPAELSRKILQKAINIAA
jgi:hypothetical protein